MTIKQKLEQRRSKLTPEQQDRLRQRLKHGQQHQTTLTIPKRSADAYIPASLTQQRVWFLEQLEQGTGAYHIPLVLRLRGNLHIGALQHSLDEIVRRHEVLRTTFHHQEGIPLQQIQPARAVLLPVIDLVTLDESEQATSQHTFIMQETTQPFDLSQDLLLRGCILRMSAVDYVLILTLHHIASDFWSVSILGDELVALYRASMTNTPSTLPVLPIQYADYACWQQQQLEGEELERELAYWQKQVGDAPAAATLPVVHTRASATSNRAATQYVRLTSKQTEQLRMFCQREGVTPFMVLLTALQITLAQYSGQSDIVVGSSSANRTIPEVEKLIGFFASTILLRCDLSDDPSVRTLLAKNKKISLEVSQHQDVPFERALAAERDLHNDPLFRIMLVLQNIALPPIDLVNVTFEPIDVPHQKAKFDLLCNFQETSDTFLGYLEYNVALFSDSLIEQFWHHYLVVLEQIEAHPEKHISAISLLSDAEHTLLITEWNATHTPFSADRCLHHIVSDQVARTPTHVAVQQGTRTLSYQELEQRTNQLASYLTQLGVGPEDCVGVYLERSPEQMVSVLAILKAGGAYVPLDPTLPVERLHFIVQDTAMKVVLTQQTLAAQIKDTVLHTCCVDGDWIHALSHKQEKPVQTVTPEHTAYIIYTSGSTGWPKGVMVSHRSVVNLCSATSRHYNIQTNDRVLQFASLSFDASVEEIFSTWCAGATLVLRPTELPQSLELFTNWLEAEAITIVDLPTAYWHLWVTEIDRLNLALPSSLRLVIVGGEKALPEHLETWCRHAGNHIRWSNTYGPTETTVTVTHYEPKPSMQGESPSIDSIPIGRPLTNVQTYILNQQMQPLPIGVVGELYIGGIAVTKGYLNRLDLTEERFIPDPFSSLPNARLYKTGDGAYYREDGMIEYVGRLDRQVKIRGFRIELGETEHVLNQQPAIQQAVVLDHQDVSGEIRLIAYVVVSPDIDFDQHKIKQTMQQFLPDYMLPSTFIPLSELPLTTNGKIDRQALPKPDQSTPSDTYVAPQTHLEEVLVGIWSDVLHREPIGIHHNFFSLGGHSLLATQVLAHIQETFEIQLPLRQLLNAPTIAELAQSMGHEPNERERLELVAQLLLSVANLSEEEVEAMLNEDGSA